MTQLGKTLSEKTKLKIFISKHLKAGQVYMIEDQPKQNFSRFFENFQLRFMGKQGIHFVFKEKSQGWYRTFTFAQLMGKVITKIQEDSQHA